MLGRNLFHGDVAKHRQRLFVGFWSDRTRRIAPRIPRFEAFLEKIVQNPAALERAVRAERALVARLEGGCQVPIGAHAVVTNASLRLDALVASVDGTRVIRNNIAGYVEDAVALGTTLAEQLLSKGAAEILAEVYNS